MKRNIGVLIITGLIPLVFLASCTKVLDKNNLGVFGGDNVWTSETMTAAYLNNLYGSLMPGWPVDGSASDEATDGDPGMNSFLQGIATIDSKNNWQYSAIDRINLFLSKIDGTPYSPDKIKSFKGQALFWRAWVYFSMVKDYGGVPLILGVQDYKNTDALFVKRNKTSECFTQIIKDLDDAASMLPDAFAGGDYGRIDKGAALAFKGRVSLFYASPLFNPTNDAARWEAAYSATKTAKEFLEGKGKGLYDGPFKDIWYNEGNKEVIMVNQFYKPDHYVSQASLRPLWITKDDWGHNEPSLFLVNSFPMKDGSAFDPAKSLAYDTLFKYRDDRFYATMTFNGGVYNTPDFKPGEKLWTGFASDGSSLAQIIYNDALGPYSRNGFWQVKGLDALSKTDVHFGKVDWVEIRFAEVLMNYGEAANETGKTAEALQVLYTIRKRAGILAGLGNYGITASSVSDIREAYIKERFVEFTFEGKRWNDLRRWRRFDIINNQHTRKAVVYWLKPGAQPPAISDNIYDPAVWSKWSPKIIDNIEGTFTFNVLDKYYFYGIPKEHLDKNAKLEQNKDWGGTFDPLQ